jgi:hypothetical protein
MKSKGILIVIGILIAIIIFSFGSNIGQDEVSELKEEVITIHDEAMARMGEIMQLKRELSKLKIEAKNDSLILINLSDLTKAHDGMMDWMRNFSARFPEGTLMGGEASSQADDEVMGKEELTDALKEELTSVKIVAEGIDKAIIAAKETLSENN